jgi:hypothetical protein
MDFTRRDLLGESLFLIPGRLHRRPTRTTGIGAARRRGAGAVLGNVGHGKRLGFEHDLVQRQLRGARRRIGSHVISRGKIRLRCNFLHPPLLDIRGDRFLPYRGRAMLKVMRRRYLCIAAKYPLAGHARHVAPGQGLDGALQADLLAQARF